MRMLKKSIILVGLALLLAAPAYADPGHGTVIYRGSDGWIVWFNWNDSAGPGDEVLIAVHSSDPAYLQPTFCDGQPPAPGEGWLFVDYHDMWIAAQKENFWVRGPLFTRVYRATLPAIFDDVFACGLVTGETGTRLAEGISTWNQNDHNTCAVGPGRNTWYWRAVGNLTAPSCPSGMAHFAMGFHYMLARDAVLDANCQPTSPTDIITVDVRGPDLTCIGR